MKKCEEQVCKTFEKTGKMGENAVEEQEYTEALHGIIMLRKGRLKDKDVWFGTVGRQLVSDGVFDTKRELIENLENITTDRVCKIVAGAFERVLTYKEGKR